MLRPACGRKRPFQMRPSKPQALQQRAPCQCPRSQCPRSQWTPCSARSLSRSSPKMSGLLITGTGQTGLLANACARNPGYRQPSGARQVAELPRKGLAKGELGQLWRLAQSPRAARKADQSTANAAKRRRKEHEEEEEAGDDQGSLKIQTGVRQVSIQVFRCLFNSPAWALVIAKPFSRPD